MGQFLLQFVHSCSIFTSAYEVNTYTSTFGDLIKLYVLYDSKSEIIKRFPLSSLPLVKIDQYHLHPIGKCQGTRSEDRQSPRRTPCGTQPPSQHLS